MALDQEVSSTHPTPDTLDQSRDAHHVIKSLPLAPEIPEQTRALMDAIARKNAASRAERENSVFQGILTAMTWIGGAAIAIALAFTLGAIIK